MADCDESAGKLILLVEDEDAHAALVTRMFAEDSSEWVVHHVVTVKDALDWMKNKNGDTDYLVISDYRLPDGTGLDLTKGAESAEDVGYPLIILTGVGSEQLAVNSLKSGAMDYVVKTQEDLRQLPQTARKVAREWEQIFERKRAEDDLKGYISDLEEASCDLEDFFDRISEDMDCSITQIDEFNDYLLNKYEGEFDEETMDRLYKSKSASERVGKLNEGLFERLLPIYFDSSLIKVYSAKMDRPK